ncbi:hypothetical protein [Streptomyces anulatus]|uniref:hypothetical protein n=1 Tax=Streptomyces anulatus TaxID=1892 RepID=UPI001D19609D|nr:hypothetical protein [Streptomyces anulatus]
MQGNLRRRTAAHGTVDECEVKMIPCARRRAQRLPDQRPLGGTTATDLTAVPVNAAQRLGERIASVLL